MSYHWRETDRQAGNAKTDNDIDLTVPDRWGDPILVGFIRATIGGKRKVYVMDLKRRTWRDCGNVDTVDEAKELLIKHATIEALK